ncbi:hypothetical protein MKX08_003556 [Trichoderma sp. CBMAI-0020]|nr:hypothetical protein MKX08_003556 [Trichoderma sp. CBMAI-0020]
MTKALPNAASEPQSPRQASRPQQGSSSSSSSISQAERKPRLWIQNETQVDPSEVADRSR